MEKIMISVFGATGFIGSKFCELYPEETIKIPREEYTPKSDTVIYFISTTDNYNIFTEPHKDIDTNLNVLISVLQNCNKNIVFNFVSSWFVYGPDTTLPIKETNYCNPKGFYPITKRCAEQLLITYCESFNINYRIFRLGNVFGETDKGAGKKKNALQYLIGELKNNRDIVLNDGGNFTRDYMYVDDVCSALHLCMQKAPLNDIMHVASGNPYKFSDLVYYCKEKLNSTSTITKSEYSSFQKVSQIKDNSLDITKLNALGFKPKYSVYEALDKIMEYL
jgi:nucleoside-diphosphate-sugar epimerase